MISKELLSEMLGIDVAKILASEWSNDISVYEKNFKYPMTYNASAYITINIYELAHKCKEWAYSQGYEIDSCYSGEYRISKVMDDSMFYVVLDGSKSNEIEAIEFCCQWILDNKDNV